MLIFPITILNTDPTKVNELTFKDFDKATANLNYCAFKIWIFLLLEGTEILQFNLFELSDLVRTSPTTLRSGMLNLIEKGYLRCIDESKRFYGFCPKGKDEE